MTRMELFCPICHHPSGNAIVADWPEPLDTILYQSLICGECGVEFSFQVDRSGMRTTAKRDQVLLDEFLKRRPYRPKVRS